jgi:hypothetical protein
MRSLIRRRSHARGTPNDSIQQTRKWSQRSTCIYATPRPRRDGSGRRNGIPAGPQLSPPNITDIVFVGVVVGVPGVVVMERMEGWRGSFEIL